MAKQCWSQTVLESGSWGHSVLQTPALVTNYKENILTFLTEKKNHNSKDNLIIDNLTYV